MIILLSACSLFSFLFGWYFGSVQGYKNGLAKLEIKAKEAELEQWKALNLRMDQLTNPKSSLDKWGEP